ncbi:MAG TPA: hypothetical protein PKI25_09900 [Nitrosomonas europaea]|nr:hypothetical protein [Nitrosomonas europaea]
MNSRIARLNLIRMMIGCYDCGSQHRIDDDAEYNAAERNGNPRLHG